MNKISLTFPLMFLLSIMVVASVLAQPRTVGVSVGDWFEYGDISVHWSSDDPDATVPSYLEDLNQTEYWVMSILDIVDTTVTVEMLAHYKNGSDEITGGFVDIDTGDGNVTMMIISANLGENDTVYTSGTYSTWKINETITKTYPDSTRDTNHLNITTEYSMPPTYQNMSLNYYWDKQSGMFAEISQEAVIQTGENVTTTSMSIRITDSSVWVIPEFPALVTIILALAVLTTTPILLRRIKIRMAID